MNRSGAWLLALLLAAEGIAAADTALCGYVLYELLRHWEVVLVRPVDAMRGLVIPIVALLYLVNYVVNIGFGFSWRRKPVIALIALFAASSILSRLAQGVWFGEPTGALLLAVMGYFYAHLGVSFLFAAVFATPGCEMRALAHVRHSLSGRDPAEHHCPAGFLHRLDQWEAARRG